MDIESTLKKILEQYVREYKTNERIKAINRKIEKGIFRYSEAETLAMESGNILNKAFAKYLPEALTNGKLYRETAEIVLKNPMLQSSRDVRYTTARIQRGINEAAGIGMNPIEPEINMDQINGIITGICNAESFDAGKEVLFDQVENFLEGTVDDYVHANADFQYQAGLDPIVIRTAAGKCCKWCSNLAGTYKYEAVRDNGNDVWRRHRNCHCTIEDDPGKKGGKREHVSGPRSTDPGRNDRIKQSEDIGQEEKRSGRQKSLESEFRNQAGQKKNSLSDYLRDNHKALAEYTPETMREALTKAGMKVEALSDGKLAGKSFEDGGGYKALFGGDGALIYHPAEGSHHKGAYWKVSGGGKETKRYGLDGNEIDY